MKRVYNCEVCRKFESVYTLHLMEKNRKDDADEEEEGLGGASVSPSASEHFCPVKASDSFQFEQFHIK